MIGQCGAIVPAHAAAARSRGCVLVEHELALLTPVGGGHYYLRTLAE